MRHHQFQDDLNNRDLYEGNSWNNLSPQIINDLTPPLPPLLLSGVVRPQLQTKPAEDDNIIIIQTTRTTTSTAAPPPPPAAASAKPGQGNATGGTTTGELDKCAAVIVTH